MRLMAGGDGFVRSDGARRRVGAASRSRESRASDRERHARVRHAEPTGCCMCARVRGRRERRGAGREEMRVAEGTARPKWRGSALVCA